LYSHCTLNRDTRHADGVDGRSSRKQRGAYRHHAALDDDDDYSAAGGAAASSGGIDRR